MIARTVSLAHSQRISLEHDDLLRSERVTRSALTTITVPDAESHTPLTDEKFNTSRRGQRGRYCTTSLDCHLDLNERCVQRGTHSICDCREPFIRDPKTNSCELKRAVRIVMAFAKLSFSTELAKKSTPAYIRTRERVEKTMNSVISYSSVLSTGVHGIRAVNFSDTPNGLSSACYLFVRESLYRQLSLDALSLLLVKEMSVAVHELNNTHKSGDYDIEVIEIDTDVNPCEIEELNYCSNFAECGRTKSGGFYCQCRERYTDLSPHRTFTGEQCVIECPEAYCANDGHCHVDSKTSALYCTCNNWNVGARCQYSGVVVFSVLGVVVILLLLGE